MEGDEQGHPDISAARARLTAAAADIPELASVRAERVLACGNRRVVFAGHLAGRAAVLKVGLAEDFMQRVARHDSALRHFAPHLGTGPFRVPDPLGAWPDLGISAQALVDGIRLDRMLTPATPTERARLLTRAGAWLRRAAGLSRQDERFGGGYWVKFLGNQSARIPGPHGDTARALARLLQDRARPCEWLVLVRAPLHGDYRAHNLLWDGEAMTAIDFDQFEVRPLAREAASFLVHLSRREPGADHAADRAALLAGCALPPAEVQDVVAFFETREIAHELVRACAGGAIPPKGLMRQAAAHLAASGHG